MKTRTNRYGLVAVLAVGGLASAGLGQTRVDRLWGQKCVECHAGRGDGARGGSLAGTSDWLGTRDRELYDAVLAHGEGADGGGLPAFEDGTTGGDLTPSEAWALVNHLREFQEQARKGREPAPRPLVRGVYQSEHHGYRVERVVTSGLETPWSVAWLADGRMLVADRPGDLRVVDGRQRVPVRELPAIHEVGQGGLMDVETHVDGDGTEWVYLSYTHQAGGNYMTRIVRGTLAQAGRGAMRWTGEEVIWEADEDDYLSGGLHYGCRLVFDGQGHLYFPIGERGRAEHAQDLTRPNGKVHRVRVDGSIPEDNPFVGEGEGVYASIWSYGHRNPQGLAMDSEGVLWDTEHGPRGGDEVNIVERGLNYGWPLVSFGMNYSGQPLEAPWADVVGVDEPIAMPVFRWLPSIAACGLDVVRADAPMFDGWEGDLLAGGLAGQVVERLRFVDGEITEREEILRGVGRVRDVAIGPDGAVYVVLNGPDEVWRLVEAE